MFNGLKNFVINRVLRHVADNSKLNRATNFLALVPVVLVAALNNDANWALMLQCCDAPGSLHEVLRVAGLMVMAVLLYFCGKASWLKGWMPIAQEVIEKAQKDIEAAREPKA